jgi:hypothetical protein
MPVYEAITTFRTRWGRIRTVRLRLDAPTMDDLVRQTQAINRAIEQASPGARIVSGRYNPLP